MSREQLEKFAHNLRNEVEREREERNFFQIERDKLRTFWEITRNQLGNILIRVKHLMFALKNTISIDRYRGCQAIDSIERT